MNNNKTKHETIINELETSQWGQYDYQEVLKAMTTLEQQLLKEIEQLKQQIQQLKNQK